MAEQEQVELLKRSVDEWNQWRQKYPEIRPDLSSANLSGTDLYGANLREANLVDANLYEAWLLRASLIGTSLYKANLTKACLAFVSFFDANLVDANLSEAHLANTYFKGADLLGADLSETNLYEADLSGANLSQTNLTKARFFYTTFAWINLSSVKGLETTIHEGPSMVDIKSVTLPHDEHICRHFLSGVGFTATQIEHLPSWLTPQPIEYHSLFISYAHQDEIVAKRLYADLRKNDVPCWFAPHDLQPGNYFRAGIDQAIHTQDKVLLLLSKHSVKSGWVRYEVELALARENRQQKETLFPIRLDDAIFDCTAGWATSLQETRHIGDFTCWKDNAAYQQAFPILLRHLKVYFVE